MSTKPAQARTLAAVLIGATADQMHALRWLARDPVPCRSAQLDAGGIRFWRRRDDREMQFTVSGPVASWLARHGFLDGATLTSAGRGAAASFGR